MNVKQRWTTEAEQNIGMNEHNDVDSADSLVTVNDNLMQMHYR